MYIWQLVDLFPAKVVVKFTLEYCNNLPSSTKVTFIVGQSRHMVQTSPSTKRSRMLCVAGLKKFCLPVPIFFVLRGAC